MGDPKIKSYYEDRIAESSGGGGDVTLAYLQTNYTDTVNLNTTISGLSSVYLTKANAVLLYAPIGSGGGGNTNISFGSVNLATFATSKSIISPVTAVSGIVTSATKINYGTGLSTTIQGNIITVNYPAFITVPKIQCQLQNAGYSTLLAIYDNNGSTCDIISVTTTQCKIYVFQYSGNATGTNVTIHLTFFA